MKHAQEQQKKINKEGAEKKLYLYVGFTQFKRRFRANIVPWKTYQAVDDVGLGSRVGAR